MHDTIWGSNNLWGNNERGSGQQPNYVGGLSVLGHQPQQPQYERDHFSDQHPLQQLRRSENGFGFNPLGSTSIWSNNSQQQQQQQREDELNQLQQQHLMQQQQQQQQQQQPPMSSWSNTLFRNK